MCIYMQISVYKAATNSCQVVTVEEFWNVGLQHAVAIRSHARAQQDMRKPPEALCEPNSSDYLPRGFHTVLSLDIVNSGVVHCKAAGP